MFAEYGKDTVVIPLDHTSYEHCPKCETNCLHSLVLQYEYTHVYYIFGQLGSQKFYSVCDKCQHGSERNLDDADRRGFIRVIPFLHRYGFHVIAVLGILGTAGAFMVNSLSKK